MLDPLKIHLGIFKTSPAATAFQSLPIHSVEQSLEFRQQNQTPWPQGYSLQNTTTASTHQVYICYYFLSHFCYSTVKKTYFTLEPKLNQIQFQTKLNN